MYSAVAVLYKTRVRTAEYNFGLALLICFFFFDVQTIAIK